MERVSPEKHEFVDGEIYTMAGGSEEHSALAAVIVAILVDAARRRSSRAHTSDLRIYVEAVRLATFPDASVVCGPLQHHQPSPETTALNPTIVVEVTSNSSEEYDLGFKREAYRTIPSLREYIIVLHRERRVIVDARSLDGPWTTRTAARGERFELPSLQAEIAVDDVYRDSNIA